MLGSPHRSSLRQRLFAPTPRPRTRKGAGLLLCRFGVVARDDFRPSGIFSFAQKPLVSSPVKPTSPPTATGGGRFIGKAARADAPFAVEPVGGGGKGPRPDIYPPNNPQTPPPAFFVPPPTKNLQSDPAPLWRWRCCTELHPQLWQQYPSCRFPRAESSATRCLQLRSSA